MTTTMTMAAHCIICIFVQEMGNGLGVNGLVVIEENIINGVGRRHGRRSI
jgi:hypothetical protein